MTLPTTLDEIPLREIYTTKKGCSQRRRRFATYYKKDVQEMDLYWCVELENGTHPKLTLFTTGQCEACKNFLMFIHNITEEMIEDYKKRMKA